MTYQNQEDHVRILVNDHGNGNENEGQLFHTLAEASTFPKPIVSITLEYTLQPWQLYLEQKDLYQRQITPPRMEYGNLPAIFFCLNCWNTFGLLLTWIVLFTVHDLINLEHQYIIACIPIFYGIPISLCNCFMFWKEKWVLDAYYEEVEERELFWQEFEHAAHLYHKTDAIKDIPKLSEEFIIRPAHFWFLMTGMNLLCSMVGCLIVKYQWYNN